jgi:hypothetical protein
MYQYKEPYNVNTVGYNDDGEFFCGETSALYFIEAIPSEMHKLLNVLYKIIPLSDLIPILSGNVLQWKHKIPSINFNSSFSLQKIIFHINPKLVSENTQMNEEVFIDKTKKTVVVSSGVSEMKKSTLVHHNTFGQTVFVNIGGIKTLIPILEHIFTSKTNIDASFM